MDDIDREWAIRLVGVGDKAYNGEPLFLTITGTWKDLQPRTAFYADREIAEAVCDELSKRTPPVHGEPEHLIPIR